MEAQGPPGLDKAHSKAIWDSPSIKHRQTTAGVHPDHVLEVGMRCGAGMDE